jgi:hypothetical protein
MKHPARGDFDTLVTEANVRVMFTPTSSMYVFHRLSDPKNIERVGPVSFVGVKHARRNTGAYPSEEVQDMAQRIASEFASCFRSALDDAVAAIGGETTHNNNITSIRNVSLASVPRHVASEIAATLQLIQNIDRADLGTAPKNEEESAPSATLASLSCDEAS